MSQSERLLTDFSRGKPPLGQRLMLLCEDQNGRYKLPFPCEWRDGARYRAEKSEPLQTKVIGWRLYAPSDGLDLHSVK